MAHKLYKGVTEDLEFVSLIDVNNIGYPHEVSMLRPHQVFPQRFLTSYEDDTEVFCFDAAVGTGKTMAAVSYISQMLRRNKQLSKLSSKLYESAKLPIPLVIGSWATIVAFIDELVKPDFGLISVEDYAKLKSLQGDDKVLHQRKLSNIIGANVMLMTYQKLFNTLYIGALSLSGKSDSVIIKAIEDGSIKINESFLEQLRNSVIIIDEAQSLYSSSGMNTYGKAVMDIRQNPNMGRLKTIMLSATFLNS